MDPVYVRQRRLEENIPVEDAHNAPSAGEKNTLNELHACPVQIYDWLNPLNIKCTCQYVLEDKPWSDYM